MTHSHPSSFHVETLPENTITPIDQYPPHTIPYHILTDHHTYSLSYATTNTDEALHETETRSNTETHARTVSFDHLQHPFYGTYTVNTNTNYGSTNLDHINNQNTRTLVDAFTSIFNGVMDHSNSTWHKPINIIRAAQTIDTVQWKQPAVTVASNLLSTLILAHTLPNTNHRSSLAFTGLYLSQTDPSFSLPTALANNPEIEHWIDSFIIDSKRTLTTRRNTGLFRWLHNHDIETVVRKNNIEISLNTYSFENTSLHTELTQQHATLCTDLLTDILLTTDSTHDLLETTDPGKRVFAQRMAATDDSTPYHLGAKVADFRD